MQLKTFRGNSMAAALCAVKKELGRDAVIVHTRTFKVGGVMGVGAKEVVEITAAVQSDIGERTSRTATTRASTRPVAHGVNLSRSPHAAGKSVATDARLRSIDTSHDVAGFIGSDRRQTGQAVAESLNRARALSSHESPRMSVSTPASHTEASSTAHSPAPQFMRVRKRLVTDRVAVSDTQAASLSHPPQRTQHIAELRSHGTNQQLPQQPSGDVMREVASLVLDGPTVTSQADSRDSLSAELGAIKSMLGELMQSKPAQVAPVLVEGIRGGARTVAARLGNDIESPLNDYYLRLIEHHVSRELADRIVEAVRDELTHSQQASPSIVREAVLRHLSDTVPISDTSVVPVRGGSDDPNEKPFTIALVGPTGVGKTTTIAKLAAAYKLKQGLRVGLITTDTYRVGAIEQLSTYAGMIGVPLKVASGPDEMQAACDELSDMDVVLIDTAGRSPRDSGRLSELGELLAAAAPDETHLVLSSTASESAMLEAANRFASVGTSRVIFTKLDEAVTFGVIFNVAQQVGTQLSFITTGQEVPDQIEATRPERLARLMLGNL